jgi:hypothetical protein
MSAQNNYLAVFIGSKTGAQRAAWDALSDSERASRQQQGMAAWGAWVAKHQDVILEIGGPLGKTKQASPSGISDTTNEMAAFTVVRADSHEAAARMFENHAHFMLFPGDRIEIMPILPVPGRAAP